MSPGVEDAAFVTIAAGEDDEVVMYAGSCLPYPMVAVGEAETIIDQHEPLCPGDLWVIDPQT